MRKPLSRTMLICLAGFVLFFAGWLAGQEMAATQKTVIHAASWTALDGLTQQQLDQFRKETAGMVGKVSGLRRAWVGKLREPVTFDGQKRDFGIILEFDDVKSKNDYSTNHPQPWYDHFNKLRKPSSSNFDVVGSSSRN